MRVRAFLRGGEGGIVVALTALNLGDVDLGLRVLRLRGDDVVEDLEGLVELAVGEEGIGEAALYIDVVRLRDRASE